MASFFYKNIPYLHINHISIIGKFNGYDPQATPLTKEKDGWYIALDLQRGEYAYKYVINGVLRLNDPNAIEYRADETGEVWSIALVDAAGKIEQRKKKTSLQLINHVVSSKVMDTLSEARHKDNFNIQIDKIVAACFELGHIVGIHTVTAIWLTPQLYMHHISDHVVEVEEGDVNDAAEIWFWIDLQEKERDYPKGTWYIKLFIDGEFMMEDKFTISAGMNYSVQNKAVIINRTIGGEY